jgi:hypothetical protein
MSQEETECQPLSGRAFVSLAEALSWIAFDDAMSIEQLNIQLEGIRPQKVESNAYYLRKFFAEDGVPEVDWPGTGHFENREQGLEKLDKAWLWLRDAVENQTISVRGRYTQTYSRADAVLADVELLTGAMLATFSQFDVSTGGIQRQTEGTPSVIWSSHPQGLIRALETVGDDLRTTEGYLFVEVERTALVGVKPTAGIASTATAKAEHECYAWLRTKFAEDPDKKRTKASFTREALAHFEKRLTQRGFLRVWRECARDAGRSTPGRKS